jgi:hypothetical protein
LITSTWDLDSRFLKTNNLIKIVTILKFRALKWIFPFHAPTGIYGSCGESPTIFEESITSIMLWEPLVGVMTFYFKVLFI